MKWDYLPSCPQTAMRLYGVGGIGKDIICRKRKKKNCGVEAWSQPCAQVIFKESQSLISQAEMTKISASYISRQDRAPVWYCHFLLGFSRAVNSACPPTPSHPSPPQHTLSSEISVTLIHRVCRWLTRKSCVNYHQPLPAGRAAGNQRGQRVFHTREEQ